MNAALEGLITILAEVAVTEYLRSVRFREAILARAYRQEKQEDIVG